MVVKRILETLAFFRAFLPSFVGVTLVAAGPFILFSDYLSFYVVQKNSPDILKAAPLFINLIWQPIYEACLILLVFNKAKGRDVPLVSLLSQAFVYWPRLFLVNTLRLFCVAAPILMFSMVVGEALGLGGLLGMALAVGPVLLLWARMGLAEYMAVFENIAPARALQMSFVVTREHTWEILGSFLALSAGIASVFVGLAIAVQSAGDFQFIALVGTGIFVFLLLSTHVILFYRFYDLICGPQTKGPVKPPPLPEEDETT